MGQQYSHLSSEERILIEKLHCEQHLSVRKIAEEIGRDKSTVSRELRRGLWFASDENDSYRPYRPKRLKTGPWTGGYYIAGPAAAQGRPQARQTAQALPPVMRTPVGAGGRMAGSRLVAAARQRQAARPVPRRLRHARVPGDRLPLDPRRPPSP